MRRTPIYAPTQPHRLEGPLWVVGSRAEGSLVFRGAAVEADVSISGTELRGDAGFNPEAASIRGHFKVTGVRFDGGCPCRGRRCRTWRRSVAA